MRAIISVTFNEDDDSNENNNKMWERLRWIYIIV